VDSQPRHLQETDDGRNAQPHSVSRDESTGVKAAETGESDAQEHCRKGGARDGTVDEARYVIYTLQGLSSRVNGRPALRTG